MSEETKIYGKSVRLEDDVLELLIDEQFRLRKLEGRRVSYSEIVRRWAGIAAQGNHSKKPVKKVAQ